ncbi:MAG TPA: hypothetical protein VF926_04255 [Mycobacterium sp.]
MTATHMALMGEEQIAAQSVQALALVQLPADSAAEFFVSDVSARARGSPRGPWHVRSTNSAGHSATHPGSALTLRYSTKPHR